MLASVELVSNYVLRMSRHLPRRSRHAFAFRCAWPMADGPPRVALGIRRRVADDMTSDAEVGILGINVLGPTQLTLNGAALTLARPLERGLFVRLALAEEQVSAWIV